MARRVGVAHIIFTAAGSARVSSLGTVVLRRHRVITYTVLVVMLVSALAFAYSSLTAGSFTATARVTLFSGGPDSLIQSSAVTGSRLDGYLGSLKTFEVDEAAVQRLPGPAPTNRASFVKASRELARTVTVGIDRGTNTLEITARASSPGQAAIVANAFVGGLLQVRGAEAQNISRSAATEALEQLSRMPQNDRERPARAAALERRLAPVLDERQVQIVQQAVPGSAPLLAMGVTAAIALIAILLLLMVTGAWQPRRSLRRDMSHDEAI
jgi:uncharacterized protein involved in exopolysaccharide biosynthesis